MASAIPDPHTALRAEWTQMQNSLKSMLIPADKDLSFDPATFSGLEYVCGVDVSFFPASDLTPASSTQEADPQSPATSDGEPSNIPPSEVAVVCMVVLAFPSLTLVHSLVREVLLPIPYIPGFLAMRECPAVRHALTELADAYPVQVLFVDGNGVWHPRGFGVASQVGVENDIPTLGVAKNVLELPQDNITKASLKERWQPVVANQSLLVVGTSGAVYGACVKTVPGNPVFVSAGHRVGLDTAVRLTLACSRFRVPEPIRFADHLGREYVRQKKNDDIC
ncbi:endonuclease V-domain-containing protein [Chytriomyces sp. MP71]|nr:endonuclease V-domain-containing protein [Chytriomyces sp. MP71]